MNLSRLKDRLYHSLGQASYGMEAPPFPFDKVNVMPEGVSPVQSPTQKTATPTQPQHAHMYQSQATANFNTSTTGSTSYMSPNQYTSNTPYTAMNGLSSTQGQGYGGQYYNPSAMASTAASAASAPSKGACLYWQ